MNSENPYERYQRQMVLRNFGEEGQNKLLRSSVLVVGAGGLGCPVLQYLVAAGVGSIGIVDHDIVQLHNLHRQVLYTTNDVGLPKASTAANRLREMNPGVEIKEYNTLLSNQNALGIIGEYDLVVDASDNFETRYMINDACVLLAKPFVFGAISEYEGQVAVFNCKTDDQIMPVNYRDLFPNPPMPGTVLNCAEAGVIGVLPGIIGTVQAGEVIKLLAHIGKPLINQLYMYNSLTNQSFTYHLSANDQTGSLIPQNEEAFLNRNYEASCSAETVNEIDSNEFQKLKEFATVIDVREKNELPLVTEFKHLQIPLSGLLDNVPVIDEETVVVFCQSGSRSKEAAKLLTAAWGTNRKIFSLKGGILQWKQSEHGEKKY